MAENAVPKKNTAFTFYVSLVDSGSRPDLRANPTLAAGDVQVSTDGAAFGNLTTLPVVTPASGVAVKVDLSASEMNGDNVTVKFIDAAGGEWDDLFVELRPATRKLEDLAYPTTTGRSIDVAATGEVGVDLGNATGTLTNTNLAFVDANERIDVGAWLGTAVTTSATTAKPQVDVDSIDDDATAADNLELDYDGTGYNKSNSTIGTTTTNTDMRGTDSAALASVVGALADAAAAGDPTATDTVVAYVKQLINTLEGTTGIPVYPASADPANNVSLAEAIRAIRDDVTGLAGAAMRGTDSALLAASAPTNFGDLAITATTGQVTVGTNNDKTGYSVSGTITTLDGLNNLSTADIDARLAAIGLDHLLGAAVVGTDVTDNSVIAKLFSSAATADFDTYVNTTDSLQAIRDIIGTPAGASIAADLVVIDDFVDGLESTIGVAGAGLTDLGGMSTTMKAEVESEVNDALDTAISELGVAAPTATPTLRTGLMLLYMMARNKFVTQTSGTAAVEVYNDAGTKITQKLLTDAAGDLTEAKMS